MSESDSLLVKIEWKEKPVEYHLYHAETGYFLYNLPPYMWVELWLSNCKNFTKSVPFFAELPRPEEDTNPEREEIEGNDFLKVKVQWDSDVGKFIFKETRTNDYLASFYSCFFFTTWLKYCTSYSKDHAFFAKIPFPIAINKEEQVAMNADMPVIQMGED